MPPFKQSFPAEVWLNIFDQFGCKQLAQCRLVCRFWKPLAEKVMYKEIDLSCKNGFQLAELSKHLSMRPDLGRLVQKIKLYASPSTELTLYEILKLTPNLRIIDGAWNELLGELLSKPECLSFKLEQLPRTESFSKLYSDSLLRFRETLRSVFFADLSNCNDCIAVGASLDQFKNLTQLVIQDQFNFRNLRYLDHLLGKCNQIQELQLFVLQHSDYVHTDKDELQQWLLDNVQKIETIKQLKINFDDDSLEDEEKQPREFGPDWMEYLAYKCPNVTKLEVNSDEYNRQHIILPEYAHMETFALKNWRFYDINVLKRFIDMLGTQSVNVNCKVNYEIHYGDSYICLMSAIKEEQTDNTTFLIQLPCDDCIKANTISVLSLFSTRIIENFDMDLSENDYLEPICASMTCNLNIDFFRITTNNDFLPEYPQQPIFSMLRRLELVETKFPSNFMTQLNKYAPSLTHLRLSNCTFEDKLLLPSMQLSELALHRKKRSVGFSEYESKDSLLFRVSTTKCPEQICLALPCKPLQRITKEEATLFQGHTIWIECESLKHLSVDLVDFKFEIEFDDDTNLIKSVDPEIKDSYYTQMDHKLKLLEKDYTIIENKLKLAEDKYSRSKKYLTASQIKAIEDTQ